MLYLFLAIICSASIALIFKHSESNQLNRYVVTTTNYFTAFSISLIMIIQSKLFSEREVLSISRFIEELGQVVGQGEGQFSINGSILWSGGVGIVAGVFFFLAFIYYQRSVNEDGVSLAGTFSKLGILVPMILSILFWRELPSSLQWVGIFLSLASILLVNFSAEKFSLRNIRVILILLFLFGGLAEFSNKIFQRYAIIEYKNLYLFFVFFTAFLISLFFVFRNKKTITFRDLRVGFMVGIPNLFSSYFLILALRTVKTTVAFPIYTAASIVLINLGGFFIFKEKLSKQDTAAVIMTIIALVLINVSR